MGFIQERKGFQSLKFIHDILSFYCIIKIAFLTESIILSVSSTHIVSVALINFCIYPHIDITVFWKRLKRKIQYVFELIEYYYGAQKINQCVVEFFNILSIHK